MSNQTKESLELNVITICITIILTSLICSVTYFNINDRILLSKNISEAIAKGADPLSVRCSYATSGDTTCIAYASKK